jgi:protein-S-isoprenylcysteine O-methyltransferase Ste14
MILLLTIWAFYFFLHSFLANETVKDGLTSAFGLSKQGYRRWYNLLNLLGLPVILLLHYHTPSADLFASNSFFLAMGLLLTIAGLCLMLLAAKSYDLLAFFGFGAETKMPLQVNGLHRYMRHPLYSGTLLLCIGICMALPQLKNWYVLILMVVYLLIGIWLEEKKLIRHFGDAYVQYKKSVKRLIPGVL